MLLSPYGLGGIIVRRGKYIIVLKSSQLSFFKHARSGFTLLELMIAFSLLTVLIVGVFSALIQFYTIQDINEKRMTAIGQINSVVDELQSLDQSEILEYIPPQFEASTLNSLLTVSLVEEDGTLAQLPLSSYNNAYVDALPNPTEIRINVAVYGKRGRDFSRTVSTMVLR